MKILTTIHALENVESFLPFVDGFMIGDGRFAKALTHDFNNELIQAINLIHSKNKEVYILLTRLFTENELKEVRSFVQSLPVDKISGFIGADLGLVITFQELGLAHKFVYNPETLLTNDEDFNDLKLYGIKGATVSKEITISDILEIGQLKQYELYMFGHGHMSMFYTKRALLDTFNDYQNKPHDLKQNESLRLKEKKRVDEAYPILEDEAGTHVFRGHIFSAYQSIEDLENVVDYYMIDTLFHDDQYGIEVCNLYKNKLGFEYVEMLIKKYDETWHDGFLYKEVSIKGEEND